MSPNRFYRSVPQSQIGGDGLQISTRFRQLGRHGQTNADVTVNVFELFRRPQCAHHVQQPDLAGAGKNEALLDGFRVTVVVLRHEVRYRFDRLLDSAATLQR